MHFPVLSTFITGFGTKLLRRVPLVEQELLTPPVHPSSPPILVDFMLLYLLYVCFVDRCLSFCTFSFDHSVPLRYTDSDYPFGIFKLFLLSVSVSSKEKKPSNLTVPGFTKSAFKLFFF